MLKFNSDPKNVAAVEPFVEKIVSEYQLSPDLQGNILISLTEAVNNAIRHGNRQDHKKNVEVKIAKKSNGITFNIIDEGDGFDFNNLPDPTAPENLLSPGGRGVFLMRQLSDDIKFHENGSSVEIRFDIR